MKNHCKDTDYFENCFTFASFFEKKLFLPVKSVFI